MNIQWYPGHMAKSRRLISEKLKIIDLVIEVVDARAPYSTKNPDFDALFGTKKRLLLLNKRDLADEAVTAQWLAYYRDHGMAAMAFCALKDNAAPLIKMIEDELDPLVERYKKRGMHKTLRCMAAGIPNVGKSALLNRMAGGRRLKAGNTPGMTRGLTWLKLNSNIELLDSPGLLWPKIENKISARNIALLKSINEDILNIEELAAALAVFLKQRYPDCIESRYRINNVREKSADEILTEICKNRGFLAAGGEPDMARAADTIIDEFQSGKLGPISLETPQDEGIIR